MFKYSSNLYTYENSVAVFGLLECVHACLGVWLLSFRIGAIPFSLPHAQQLTHAQTQLPPQTTVTFSTSLGTPTLKGLFLSVRA